MSKFENLVVFEREWNDKKTSVNINTNAVINITWTTGTRKFPRANRNKRLQKLFAKKHPILSKFYSIGDRIDIKLGAYFYKPRVLIKYPDCEMVIKCSSNAEAKYIASELYEFLWGEDKK